MQTYHRRVSGDLLPLFRHHDRLTLAEAFGFLFRHHLGHLPCARPFNSNRKAIVRNIGHIFWDSCTEPDVLRHISIRKSGSTGRAQVGPQTIRHDLKLITLLHNTLKRWKKRRYILDDFNFSHLLMPEDNPASDIRRPKTKPRKKPITPDQFSLWIEHAPERLRRRAYFAIDTGLSPCELMKLGSSLYNPVTDCLDLQRGKTGQVGSLPVTDRCRPVILEAIRERRKLLLDWTNHQRDVEETRRRSGVYFWFGRDLRTTYYNQVLRGTNRDYRAAQRAMLHSDARTGPAHYEVDDGRDLRPAIRSIEKIFSSSENN